MRPPTSGLRSPASDHLSPAPDPRPQAPDPRAQAPDPRPPIPDAAGSAELQSVTRAFDGVLAVDRLDLAVKGGEFLSVLGPSGCGKTTTLRMLAGFERLDEGRVWLAGVDVTDVPPYRRDVNTVFQHYALFPHMTVAQNVAYGLRQRGVTGTPLRSAVHEALEIVSMQSMAVRRPAQLSGGQQQRVALARALVNRPAVLLLDEPLGALDRGLRDRMQTELKQLQTQLGITFVYVTHDQDEALTMSDRVAVMQHGRIVQLGSPEEIYDRPATPFVAGFVGRQNFLTGRIEPDGLSLRGPGWLVRADAAGEGAVVGQPGVAAIRPESIEVLPTGTTPPDRVNAVAGVITARAIAGDAEQFVVEASPDCQITARRLRHATTGLPIGTRVWCRWPSSAVRLFGAAPDQ